MARKKASGQKKSVDSDKLAPSSLHGQIASLEKEYHKLLQQIDKKQGEMQKFTDDSRQFAQDMFSRISPLFEKMSTMDDEVHQLFAQIFSSRKLGKRSAQQIKEVYSNLQWGGVISPRFNQDDLDDELEDDEDDLENDEQEDYFGNSQQSPDPFTHKVAHKTEHLRDIRSLFLKLAEKYHPDKTHEENRDMYTEIMKDINLAYKSGDYARLVELEKQLLQEEIVLEKAADYDQIRHLEVLKKKIEILKSQLESIKLNLSKIKKTPPGEMTLEYQKALKQGINIIDLMTSQVESRASVLQGIRDFVQDFKDKKITIKRFVEGPDILNSQQNFDEIDELINSLF